MSELVLFEDDGFVNLLPFTFWRTVFELRVGRKILLDQIAQHLGRPITGIWTRDWIAAVAEHRCGAPANRPLRPGTLLVNGRWLCHEPFELPNEPCVGWLDNVPAFICCDEKRASSLQPSDLLDRSRPESLLAGLPGRKAPGRLVRYAWDAVNHICDTLQHEWHDGEARVETELDTRTMLESVQRIHMGERADIHPTAVIDATDGPIYVSHDVTVGPFAVLEGPLYVGPGTWIRPHTWLHGGNAIGPVCKLGGEIQGCVIHGYTNKQHSGFLGHSYIGSWVNLGAGANNSDLKNTYGTVRVPVNGDEVDAGTAFLGCFVGDHVKVGINGSLPTGAVLGFAAVTGAGVIVPKYVPSFGWVTSQGISAGMVDRLLDVAAKVMARRNLDLTDDEVELFLNLGDRVQDYEAGHRR
jgi:UDP-N-acetylglucosamine diphosphorylase/glucosamine-1-phosphate N-acetyltransferase